SFSTPCGLSAALASHLQCDLHMPTCDLTSRPKPTVFIGSSAEGLAGAKLLRDCLEPELELVIWNENLFELGEDTLTSLLKFVSVFDFGVFVLGADDLV